MENKTENAIFTPTLPVWHIKIRLLKNTDTQICKTLKCYILTYATILCVSITNNAKNPLLRLC